MSLRIIAIILVTASLTGANAFRLDRRSSEHSDDAVQSLSSMKAEVFRLVNNERAKVGAPKLCYNTKLRSAAQAHSLNQQSCGRMSHTGCDGSSVKDRLARVGYSWRTYAENVARGQSSAAAVMRSWMQSDGHRKNILNPALKNIGIGLSSKFYWTQKFGTPKSGSGCDFKSRMEQDGEVSTHDSEIGSAVFGDADDAEDDIAETEDESNAFMEEGGMSFERDRCYIRFYQNRTGCIAHDRCKWIRTDTGGKCVTKRDAEEDVDRCYTRFGQNQTGCETRDRYCKWLGTDTEGKCVTRRGRCYIRFYQNRTGCIAHDRCTWVRTDTGGKCVTKREEETEEEDEQAIQEELH